MSIETNNKLVGKLGSSNIKGSGISVKGETGNGIDKIEKTNSVGLIDTYTIYFTDGNTTTFTITNGKNGIDGVNGTNGENGKSLQFNWNGTQLGIRTEGSTEYTYVDLKGNKGDKGDPGEVTLEQLNTSINNTKTEIQNELNTSVGNATKTTQTTEVSEELTIENCAGVKGKLDINSGKTIQEEGTPSTDNIIPIRNVGDNINWFNAKSFANASSEYYSYDEKTDTLKIKKLDTREYRHFTENQKISLPNGKYCFSSPVGLRIYDTKHTEPITSNQFEVTEGFIYLKLISSNVVDVKIKLDKGSTATPYTPYNCGSADIKVVNKNLAQLHKENGFYVNATGAWITNVAFKSYIAEVQNGKTYYASGVHSNLVYFDKNMNYISGMSFENGGLFIPNDNKIYYATFAVSVDSINVQVEENNSATPYVPHQEQIKSFPFTEGQVLHKGDYLASDGIHQKRKTLVLDGTETIAEVSNNRFQIALPLKAGDGYQKIISLCSHFKSITQLDIISTTNNNVVAVNGNYVYFRVNSEETLDNFKNRLTEQYANGTPVTIEYELAEEIVIPYTKEQEEAYYELQHLLMYEGYTKIECIDEIKPDIQGTYYFNNELNNMYISRIDSLEEKIRLLEKAVSTQTSEVSE